MGPATGIDKQSLSSRLEGACDRNGEISWHQPLTSRFLHCARNDLPYCHFDWREPATGMEKSLATNHRHRDSSTARHALRSERHASLFYRGRKVDSGSVPPFGRFLDYARNDLPYCHFDWRAPATGIDKQSLSFRLEGACDRNGEISWHQPLTSRFLHCARNDSPYCHFDWREPATGMEKSLATDHRHRDSSTAPPRAPVGMTR